MNQIKKLNNAYASVILNKKNRIKNNSYEESKNKTKQKNNKHSYNH